MRTTRHQRLRAAFFLRCALATIGLTVLAYGLGFLNDFERQSVDARFSIRGNQGPPPGLLVVKIDDVTFSELNKQFPFPRSYHAKVIDRIARDGARVIAYDVQFSEYSDPAQDNALYLAIKRHPGKVVLAATETDEHGNPNLIFSLDDMNRLHARAGSANFVTDKGNVFRKLPYELGGLKSLSVVAAEIALGHPIARSQLGGGGEAWID